MANGLGWTVLWKHGFRLKGSVHPTGWKAILIPSSHYAVSSMMSNLYHRSGQIIVRWLLGGYELGIYAAAVRFMEIVQQFVTIVLHVLMPRIALSAKSNNDVARLTRLGMNVIALLSIPMVFGLVSTAHLIVPWAMGANFAEVVPLLRWMSPYILIASTASLFSGTILYATGRYRAYLASTSSGAAAGLAAYLILIPVLGLKGASLAFMVGQLVVTIVAYLLVPTEVRNSWKSPVFVVAFAAGLVMMLVIKLVSFYNDKPLIVLSTGAVVYILACLWPIGKWLIHEFGGLQTRDVGLRDA
jgi:O-antigen/teichoic acid export membrane protein